MNLDNDEFAARLKQEFNRTRLIENASRAVKITPEQHAAATIYATQQLPQIERKYLNSADPNSIQTIINQLDAAYRQHIAGKEYNLPIGTTISTPASRQRNIPPSEHVHLYTEGKSDENSASYNFAGEAFESFVNKYHGRSSDESYKGK